MKTLHILGAVCAAVFTFTCCDVVDAALVQADLVPGSGDGLIVRDTSSGLDWLRLTETKGLSVVDVIDNGVGGYADMGFDLASKIQVEEMFVSGGIVELSTGFVEDNFLPASDLIDLFGVLQDTMGDLLTTQGWVQVPDPNLPDWVVGGVVQTASCCPPSGRAYVLDISAQPKTTRRDTWGVFLVRSSPITPVSIDIKPRKNPKNVIDLRKDKELKVAIVGSITFLALQVDPTTVKFGTSGASPINFKGKDYNRDGFSDLILIFNLSETGIVCGVTEATLTGETVPDPVTSITGSDSFTVEPCY